MTLFGDIDVLLAEDNPADAELIIESLRNENLADRLHRVHDGEEALDFLLARGVYEGRALDRPPRLVLLDVKLPKVDGLKVLEELKRDPRTRPIPVVMLTSSNIEHDVARGYLLGANSYVQKPVEYMRFQETVRRLGLYWLATNEAAPAVVFMRARE
ncbi:MAG TPA: response regulator [Gemmatimonadaceae bacterium]|jgi:CheY-like chemotaxis protein